MDGQPPQLHLVQQQKFRKLITTWSCSAKYESIEFIKEAIMDKSIKISTY
jgi:hypothetical protein